MPLTMTSTRGDDDDEKKKKRSPGLGLGYENEDRASLRAFEEKGYRTHLILHVNGRECTPSETRRAQPDMTLLTFLRTVLKLTGSKLGCAEGGCGACTVMLSRYDSTTDSIEHLAVNACLMPVCAADLCHVTTVEGVGGVNSGDGLHPIQERMVAMHGSQCGFCTPGIVVALYALFASGRDRVADIEEGLDGNLCRCTGYRPIWDAARSLCSDADDLRSSAVQAKGPCGESCATCPTRFRCDMRHGFAASSCAGHGDDDEGVAKAEVGGGGTEIVDDEEDKKEEVDRHGGGRAPATSHEPPSRRRCSEECSVVGGSSTGGRDSCVGTVVATTSRSKLFEARFSERIGKAACNARAGEGDPAVDRPTAMFPDALLGGPQAGDDDPGSKTLVIVGDACTWFKPVALSELLDLLTRYPGAKIVVGNTEVGIETKFKHAVHHRYIHASSITELTSFIESNSTFEIGACTPLSIIQHRCEDIISSASAGDGATSTPSSPSSASASGARRRTAFAMFHMLRWFASTQIRNTACLGGNLATASPIADMNPLLAAMGATLEISSSAKGPRTVPVSDFFLSYRKVDLAPDEVIATVHVPMVDDVFEYVLPFKQARRREDDISIVTAGLRVKVAPSEDRLGHFVVKDACFAFGGMAPKTVLATKTADFLIGMPWNEESFDAARRTLAAELTLDDDVPGGQVEYRRALAASFLFKFFLAVTIDISRDVEQISRSLQMENGNFAGRYTLPMPAPPAIAESELSGADSFLWRKKPSVMGTQVYPSPRITPGLEDNAASTLPKLPASKASSGAGSLGHSSTHASAALHCTGEALYVDDIPQPHNMLHAALVLSDRTNCRLLAVDKTEALARDGVIAVLTYDDLLAINGDNRLGPIMKDEQVFATDEIRHVGMVIGVVVGRTLEVANAASRLVRVTYEPLPSREGGIGEAIVSIEDAIAAGSFYESTRHILKCGDAGADLDVADESVDGIVVSGEFRVGGQEHFYLECQSSLVVPTENGLEIFASTQSPSKTQLMCASATNTPAAHVTCRTKRLGGGFGGKETRNVFLSAVAAVAAKITRHPVNLTLNRDVDMSITGNRHSFLAKYRASATLDRDDPSCPPKLGALDVQLYSNAGGSLDLSGPIVDRALFHVDGTYRWQSFRAEGVACRTMQPPHTAFRGFGGPQGIATCEHIMDHLAHACGSDIDAFRRANMYREKQHTPFGMEIGVKSWNVPDAWDRLYSCEVGDVAARRAVIDEFNKKHRWKKRGLAMVPTKFGIAFTAKFMNQGGSLVHLYTDGTVLVSHGGTEMGQGLHTKVAQVAAHAFGIPLSSVHINETATDKVANTIPTAASQSTDLYGMATLDACRKILANIKPVRDRLGEAASLAEVATAAHFERIDLSAHGFYIVPSDRCGYDWDADEPDSGPGEECMDLRPENSFRGQPFNYFTQGVAVSEVEIDVLSGDHRTLRSDVMVDVGSSINPSIDIGQIEGAFIQGMGWCTLEEMVWGDADHTWVRPRGALFTRGPGTYKIPAFNDTPEIFNVSLMDTVNPFAVHSSKAIGEPPFFLGCSVFFAIKDAVRSARRELICEEGHDFVLRMPATSERIRMACGDMIAAEGIVAAEFCSNAESTNRAVADFQPKGSY